MAMINELEFIFVSSKSSNATEKIFSNLFNFLRKKRNENQCIPLLVRINFFGVEISIQPFSSLTITSRQRSTQCEMLKNLELISLSRRCTLSQWRIATSH